MKVVLFCGGMGLRLRDKFHNTPKPLALVGQRPLIWHLMNYYSFYGHNDFVLCLGYRGEDIKRYFLDYEEAISNDFVLSKGGRDITLLNKDIEDWTMTFVDTGLHSNVAQRLHRVRDYVGSDELFLANYSDALTDLPLDEYVEHFHSQPDKVAAFVSVLPSASFHFIESDNGHRIKNMRSCKEADLRINGGFFIFRREIFDYLGNSGEDIVDGALRRLIAEDRIIAYRYDGFWQCMDTFKDRQALESLDARGDAPWTVLRRGVAQNV